jgi:hypothetical protein
MNLQHKSGLFNGQHPLTSDPTSACQSSRLCGGRILLGTYLTENGQYSAKSTYKAIFHGSNMLAYKLLGLEDLRSSQNQVFRLDRIWTPICLYKRGWPNYAVYPLCKRVHVSVDHLFFLSFFFFFLRSPPAYSLQIPMRLWGIIKDWLGLHFIDLEAWRGNLFSLGGTSWWSSKAQLMWSSSLRGKF